MSLGSFKASSLLCAAVVVSAHGVQGHVKVKCFLEDPAQLKTYSPFFNEKGEEAYKVKKILSQDKDVLIISLDGITNRDQAELLKGSKLMLPQERLPALADNTFYHGDLMGLSVVSSQGELLGNVHAVHNFGAGDILEVKTLKGTLQMIPFTQDAVPEVSTREGRLVLSEVGDLFLKGGKNDS